MSNNNEPIFSVFNSKCSETLCTWVWDSSVSLWVSPTDPCTPAGCGNCPYPSFNGTTNGETTTTACV
jgi:hypothetical protein